MFKYQIISTYKEEDIALYDAIYEATDSINQYYPKHRSWFYGTFLSGLKSGERIIVYCSTNCGNIAGVSLLKKSKDENKACCLFVKEEYQRNGIGSILMEKTLEVFDGQRPLMTVSEVNLPKLEKLMKRHGFELLSTKIGEYLDGEKEFCFN